MQIQNTKDIIKILPLEDVLKQRLLKDFDTLPLDVKDEIMDILWDAHDEIYNRKLSENMQLGIINGANGDGELEEDFYNSMVEKTEKEMGETSTEHVTQVDLQSTRQALVELLNQEKNPQAV